MRYLVFKHLKEFIVFDSKDGFAVLNYRTFSAAQCAANKCNAADRVVETPYR